MPPTSGTTQSDPSGDDLLFGDGVGVDVTKMNIPDRYIELVKKAVKDPIYLTPFQLTEVADIFCAKAFEKSIYSYPISSILVTIVDKNTDRHFTNSLVRCCRDWFNERNDRLRPAPGSSTPKYHRWPAYVSFITDFYLNLKCKLRGVKLMEEEDQELNEEDENTIVRPNAVHFLFADLLLDCCSDILSVLETTRTPASEIECLLNVFRSVGMHIERDRPIRMGTFIEELKSLFVGPVSARLPENCVKSLLEIIEWAASGWKFTRSQTTYYYPSMSERSKVIRCEVKDMQ